MTEESKYLLKTIVALEDVHAYLCHAEQIVRADGTRRGLLYALQNNRQTVLKVHDTPELLEAHA